MTISVGNLTPATLIDRLGNPEDHEAWQIFYRQYGPLILHFCRNHGCQYQVAEEVLQEVMVYLLERMSRFSYDREHGSFRGYLKRVVECRLFDAFRRQKRKDALHTEYKGSDGVQKRSTTEPKLNWDHHWKQMVLRQALDRVRMKVTETTYQSFEMYVLEEKPVKTVADRLKLSRNTIYQHKQRVMKLIQHEAAMIALELGEEVC